ncbi:MAG: hypothetical protein Q9161_001473 [Pseudevernia consocians]
MQPATHPAKPPPSKKPPHERARAKKALRAERRAVIDTLETVTTHHKRLIELLGHFETENEQWQIPNADSGEMYRLQDEIEQVEKQMRECHQRWDELGGQIEEKHVEIAFGGSGDD